MHTDAAASWDLYRFRALLTVADLLDSPLVLEERSQWVVGQNGTEFGNNCQIGLPKLLLQQAGDKVASFLLIKIDSLL